VLRPAVVRDRADCPEAVVLPAPAAAALRAVVATYREGAIRERGGVPDWLAEALDALEVAGKEWIARRGMSPSGPKRATADATMPTSRRELSTDEVASRFDCSPRHVRRLATSGALSGERRGRDWRFSPEDIDRYEKDHRR
jgi:excisionase family DNA binding protein